MNRWIVIAIVAVLAAALGAAAALWHHPSHEERAAEVQPLETPDTAPDFTLADLDGNARSFSEWDDRIVVVNFWATWCAPCRREIPVLVDLQAKHDPSELAVLGIAIDEADAVREYVEQIGMTYPTLVGQLEAIQVAARFGNHIGALPYTAIVGPDRKILWLHAGEVTAPMLEEALSTTRK